MRRLPIRALLPTGAAALALAAAGCGGGQVASTQVDHDTVQGGPGQIEFTVQRPAAADAVQVQIDRHVGDTAVEHTLVNVCPGAHVPVLRRLHLFAFACVPIHHTSHDANFQAAQVLSARGACEKMTDDSVLVRTFGRPCDVTYSASSNPGTDGRLDLRAITVHNGQGLLGQRSYGATFQEGIALP